MNEPREFAPSAPSVPPPSQGAAPRTGAPRTLPARARYLGIALLVSVGAVLVLNIVWVARHLGQLRALGPGQMAPDFELPTLEGDLVRSTDLRGRVLLLDFWSITCPPCLKSLPELNRVARTFADQPVTVLGIHTQGGRRWQAAVTAEVAMAQLSFTVLLDEGGRVSEAYTIRFLPTTVLVDRRGRIRKVWRGANDPSRYEAEIRRALRE